MQPCAGVGATGCRRLAGSVQRLPGCLRPLRWWRWARIEVALALVLGRNLYPHDLERTAEAAHAAFRPGCSAAFLVEGGRDAGIATVQEIGPRDLEDAAIAAVREAIARDHDVRVRVVVRIRPRTLPKTPSGRVQRYACRLAFHACELDVLAARSGPGDARRRDPDG